MMQGFTHQDLKPAFQLEIDQAKEERSVERQVAPPLLEQTLAKIVKVSGPIFGASAVALLIAPAALLNVVSPVFALSGSMAALSALGLLSVRQRRRDVDTEFWSKVWAGPIGTTAFSIAQRLLGDKKPALAMTHRATELSLGMAAEQLYEDLPDETRQALGDVPSLVQRLQGDAQSLRKRYDEVQEMLAKVGDAASGPQFADLRGVRDTIHAKLSEAVGALETIRLNLLRLHAGSATVPNLTTHLNLAAEVSAEVGRLLAAHVEVESALGRAS
jgi:serine/threonine-protein kinase